MKIKSSLLTFLMAASIAGTVNAQKQSPDAGFENWVSAGSAENPSGWSSLNNFENYRVPIMSFKTTDTHTGTYALRLTSLTAIVPPPFGTNKLEPVTGFVFLGGADMRNPGITYTDRPEVMRAFVKGTIVSGGCATITASLRKWNLHTHSRDQVGQAMYFMTASAAGYTEISIPFIYSLSDIPDTLEIKITAADIGIGGKVMAGNELFIDDISFTNPSAITKKPIKEEPVVNISPVTEADNITFSSVEKINTIEIYNVLGENFYSSPLATLSSWNGAKAEVVSNSSGGTANTSSPSKRGFKWRGAGGKTIDLSNFEKGIYFVKVYGGEENYTEKIVIE